MTIGCQYRLALLHMPGHIVQESPWQYGYPPIWSSRNIQAGIMDVKRPWAWPLHQCHVHTKLDSDAIVSPWDHWYRQYRLRLWVRFVNSCTHSQMWPTAGAITNDFCWCTAARTGGYCETWVVWQYVALGSCQETQAVIEQCSDAWLPWNNGTCLHKERAILTCICRLRWFYSILQTNCQIAKPDTTESALCYIALYILQAVGTLSTEWQQQVLTDSKGPYPKATYQGALFYDHKWILATNHKDWATARQYAISTQVLN